jgi:Protein of unknown function (DUF1580)
MSIDVANETIITLGEACRAVPPHGVSTATMARWIQRGVRGARLETVIIGGRRFTSREAIARFISEQNTTATPTPVVTPAQRERQAKAAQIELSRAGV